MILFVKSFFVFFCRLKQYFAHSQKLSSTFNCFSSFKQFKKKQFQVFFLISSFYQVNVFNLPINKEEKIVFKEFVQSHTFGSIHKQFAFILTLNTHKLQVGLKFQASTQTFLTFFCLLFLMISVDHMIYYFRIYLIPLKN